MCNRVGNLLGEGRGGDARFCAAVAWLMSALSAAGVGGVIIARRRALAALFVDGDEEESRAVLDVAAALIPITSAYSMLATLAPGWSQQARWLPPLLSTPSFRGCHPSRPAPPIRWLPPILTSPDFR